MNISPEHLTLVKDILLKHLPPEAKVWVFGSRARGKVKQYSDLDLAINLHGQVISIELLAALSFDFQESDLPYKVDIIDWNSIDKSFQNAIKNDLVELVR
ncbi:MAG: nucleotidyltransferase family protein [Gammaproteobacteria bacterium]